LTGVAGVGLAVSGLSPSVEDPTELLEAIKQLYERLASEYASRDLSDDDLWVETGKTMRLATYNFIVFKNTIRELLQVTERLPGLMVDIGLLSDSFESYEMIVTNTYYFFKGVAAMREALEHSRALYNYLEREGLLYAVGEVIFTPLKDARIDKLYELLNMISIRLSVALRLHPKEKHINWVLARAIREMKDTTDETLFHMLGVLDNATALDGRCEKLTGTACTQVLRQARQRPILEEPRVTWANIPLTTVFTEVATITQRFIDLLKEWKEKYLQQ